MAIPLIEVRPDAGRARISLRGVNVADDGMAVIDR